MLKPIAPRLIHLSVAPFVAVVAPDRHWSARVGLFLMLLARLALGGVLLYAGVLKAPNTGAFADTIANYEILPPLGNWLVALTLPWAEIVVGMLLICGLWLRGTALVAGLMFLGFGAGVIAALARDLDIVCGCFGTEDGARVGAYTLLFEALGLAAGVLVTIFPRQSLAFLRLPKKAVVALAKRKSRVPTAGNEEGKDIT